MAEEEPEEKEYRWESGYEKTWYVLMLCLLRQCNAYNNLLKLIKILILIFIIV